MTQLLLCFGVMMFGVVAGVPKTGPSEYKQQVEKWRAEQESDLKRDEGWLTLAGLYWLKEGDNSMGAGPGYDLELPAGSAAGKVGVLTRHDGKVTLTMADGVHATCNGNPVTTLDLKSDAEGAPDRISIGRLTFIIIHRGSRVGVRLWDKESPNRSEFTGMHWFPVEDKYRVSAKFVPYDPPKPVTIMNVLGDGESDHFIGYVTFELDGHECRLDALESRAGLFFNFKDATSGKATYPAGRFLYTPKPESGTVTLDFNEAVNPPCAFTAFATCPLPPKENVLFVEIAAGEKRHR